MMIRDVVRAGLFALTTLSFAACGGASTEPVAQGDTSGGEGCGCGHHEHGEGHDHPGCACHHGHGEGHGHGHEHGQMPAEMASFHEALRPVWHGGEGAARAQAACDASATFTERAQAVAGSSAPEGVDAVAWSSAGANLVTKVQALSTACAADATTAEPALSEVHDAFHALLELAH